MPSIYRIIPSICALLITAHSLASCSSNESISFLPEATSIKAVNVAPTEKTIDLPVELQAMFDSMQSGKCILPCYLDINPNKTTAIGAEQILKRYGSAKSGEYPEGTFTTYLYTISAEAPQGAFSWFSINLLASNDIIQKIKVIAVLAFPGYVSDINWEQIYSVRAIFLQMGQPDKVFIYSDDDIRLLHSVYLNQGVTVSLGSQSWRNDICTGRIINPYHISMNLNDMEYAENFIVGNLTEERSIGRPLNEVLGIGEAEFYQLVISDPALCFDFRER